MLDRFGLTRVLIIVCLESLSTGNGAWLGSQFGNRVSTHDGGRQGSCSPRSMSGVLLVALVAWFGIFFSFLPNLKRAKSGAEVVKIAQPDGGIPSQSQEAGCRAQSSIACANSPLDLDHVCNLESCG